MLSRVKKFGLTAALFAPVAAFAAPIDTTAIESAISEGQAAGIKVALAFAVAVLGIAAVRLLRRG